MFLPALAPLCLQVLPALAPLLLPGARAAPVQDLQLLVELATRGTAATAATATAAPGPNATAPSGGDAPAMVAVSKRPWTGMVPLQERLAQLGVAGRDLASLASLGADAWWVRGWAYGWGVSVLGDWRWDVGDRQWAMDAVS